MTVPGLYPPVRRGDQRLVDAVILTPVPTAALAGVDVTIAVNSWPSSAARVAGCAGAGTGRARP